MNASRLIPSYLDGELSEAQAGPLRKHLLDCQPCRATAQGEKNLKRWFVASAPVAIPRDFSARIARRAFAGDTGERHVAPQLSLVGAASDDRQLRFVLQLTAAAAAILIFVSIALSRMSLPGESRLRADDQTEITLEQALEKLDRLDDSATTGSAVQPVGAPAASSPAAPASEGLRQ